MRLAPVPLFFAGNPEEAIEMSGESSRTTHGNIFCIDACRYLCGLIVGAVNGAPKRELLSPMKAPITRYWDRYPLVPEIEEIAMGSFKKRNPPAIKGTGYVVQSLEAALWAFHNSSSFEEGCLKAVNLDDDADTIGAVYGQLAEAFYGEEGIPEGWRKKIAMRGVIEDYAEMVLS